MQTDTILSVVNKPSPVKPLFVERELAASTGQQRIAHASQIAEPNYLYNGQMEVRIEDLLDMRFLERCLEIIIERHQALRTVFRQTDQGDWIQVVTEPLPITVPLIPIGTHCMDSVRLEQAISRESLEQGQAEYDLATGPLFRVCVLQLPEKKQILLFSFHHIIMDGRSLTLLLREINALYATATGITDRLNELLIQDADYANFEQQLMKTNAFQQRLEYWQEQLKSTPPSLNFPFDYPTPVPHTAHGAWEKFNVSETLTQRLTMLARWANVSLYTVILAAYKTLLLRYSGQTDLSVATIIANRSRLEMENLMGCVAETVILRSDLSAEKTFKQLMVELQALTAEVFYKQAVPFNQLVDIVDPNSKSTPISLCQAALIYKSIPFDRHHLMGRSISHPTLRPMGIAKFDMTLSLELVAGRLQGYFEYNTALLSAESVKQLLQHLYWLLESVVEDPGKTITTIWLLAKEESRKTLPVSG